MQPGHPPSKHDGATLDWRQGRSDLKRFLADAFRTSWHRIALVTGLGLLAAMAQIGFAYAVFRLLFAPSTSESVSVAAMPENHVLIGLVVLSLLAAILPFLLQKLIIRYTARYMSAGIAWVRTRLFEAESRYALFATGLGRGEIVRLMTTEVRYAAQSYASVLQIIFPGLLSIGGLIALGVVRPIWTLAILAILLPSLFIATRIVLSGVRLNEKLRAAARAHSHASNLYVNSVSRHFSANHWDDANVSLPASRTEGAYVEAYRQRLVLGVSLVLAMDFVTFGVLALVAVLILTGRLDLGAAVGILIYGLVLRFVLSKLSQCMNLSIGVVSQLPFYANYLRARTQLDGKPARDNTTGELEFATSRRFLIHPEGAGWMAARDYVSAIASPGSVFPILRESVLLSSTFGPLFNSYALTFQRPDDESSDLLLGDFPASERRRGHIARLDEISEPITRKELESMHAVVRFLASIRYAETRSLSGRVVFVNATDYVRLTMVERDWLDTLISDSHAVFIAPDTRFHENLGEDIDIFALMDSELCGPLGAREARQAIRSMSQGGDGATSDGLDDDF